MVKAVLRGVAAAAHAAETLPLSDAIASLLVATESRDGYSRDKFRHWNAGDDP